MVEPLTEAQRLSLLEQVWSGLCRPGPEGDAARREWDGDLRGDDWLHGTGPRARRAAAGCLLACPALGACAVLAEEVEHSANEATRDVVIAGVALPAARRGGASKGRPGTRPALLSREVAAWVWSVA